MRIFRYSLGIAMFIVIAMVLTSCVEIIPDGMVHNEKVEKNMENYVLNRYGESVKIESLYATGGSISGVSYESMVKVGDNNVLLKCSYDSDSEYGCISDTLIDTLYNKGLKKECMEKLKGYESNVRLDVFSSVKLDSGYNFGHVPTYEDIVECGAIDKIKTKITVVVIMYVDEDNLKAELRNSLDKFKSIMESELGYELSVYFVDTEYKDRIDTYLSENDIKGAVSMFNRKSVSDAENKNAVCNNVLRLNSMNYKSASYSSLDSYIDSIDKKK